MCSAPLSTSHLLVGCPPSNLVLLQRDSIAEDAMPTALRAQAQAAASRGGPAPPAAGDLWDPAQWPALDVYPTMLHALVTLRGMTCHGAPCAMLRGPLGLARDAGRAASVGMHQMDAWPRTVVVTTGGQVLVVEVANAQEAGLIHDVVQSSEGDDGEEGAVLCDAGVLSAAAHRGCVPADTMHMLRMRMHELARSVM